MRLVSIVLPVDQRNLVGSTVHGKSIHVIDKAEFNRLYGSQKKVKRFEGVVVNVDQKLLNKGGIDSMLFLTKKTLMEVSIGTGYTLSLWLQDQF